MNDDQHQQTPTTIKEVGIHIGYMRDDIAEMKTTMKDFTAQAATKAEILALDKRLTSVEKFQQDNSDISLLRKLVYGAVGIILFAVLSAIVALVVFNQG